MAVFGVRKSASDPGETHTDGDARTVTPVRALGLFASAMLVMSGAVVGGSAAQAVSPENTCVPGTSGDTRFTNCQQFSYAGADYQTFTVPENVHSVTVQVWGAGGGGVDSISGAAASAYGAAGGFVQGTIEVEPGDTYTMLVGQGGQSGGAPENMTPLEPTWGGGGAGGDGQLVYNTGVYQPQANGSSGGGLSAFIDPSSSTLTEASALLIAGGGGGASVVGAAGVYPGGGGLNGGQDGVPSNSGRGGTQSAGGAAGTTTANCVGVSAGSRFSGGTGGSAVTSDYINRLGGGGGGGGWFGGGGGKCKGAVSTTNGAGGGGSSYIDASRVLDPIDVNGGNGAPSMPGMPHITGPSYVDGVATGGGYASLDASYGGNGLIVIQWDEGYSYSRSAAPSSVSQGDDVTFTVTVDNTSDRDFPAGEPIQMTEDLAGVLDEATLVADSFTTTVDGWTMGAPDAEEKALLSGPLDRGASVTMSYRVKVKDIVDLPESADYVLNSGSTAITPFGFCGDECTTATGIDKTLTLTPATVAAQVSQKITYAATITDGLGAERTVTDEATYTSAAGSMVGNVLTVAELGDGLETVASYGQHTATATVDAVASNVPAVTINPTNGTTISGTGVTGNTVTVTLPGGAVQTVVVVDGTWSITPSETLANGDVVSVVQTDENEISSLPATVTIDQVKPAAPTVKTSNGKTITGGPVAAGSTLEFKDGDQNPIPGTVVIDPETGLFTFTPATPITSDSTVVDVVLTSPAGNVSDPSRVELVTTAPTAPSVGISDGQTITGGPVAKGDKVSVVDGNGDEIKGSVSVDSEGKFTFTPDEPLKNGDVAKVVVTGPSGLKSTPKDVELLTVAPTAPAVEVSNGKTVTGGPIAEGDTVSVVDGKGDKIKGSVTVDSEGKFTFTPDVPLSDDDVARVVVTGPSGLKSTPEEVIVVTKAPAVPVVKPSDGVTITGGPVGKNDTVTVWNDQGDEVKGSVMVDPEGNFVFTPDVPLTKDDRVTVLVTGPSGLKTESDEVEIITTAPTAPVVKPSDGKTIKGGPIGDRDEVIVRDGNGDPIKGKVEVDGEGNFTFTPDVPLTDEDTAKVVVLGPSGLESAPVDVDLSTTAPAAPAVKPSDGQTIKGGKIGEGDTVTVLDGDNNPIKGKIEVDAEGNFTFTPDVPLAEGDSVKVVITGPSGLESDSSSVEIITTPPTAPVVKPSDGQTITGGKIGKDDTVTVWDDNGDEVKGSVEVDGEGNFTFTPDMPLTEADKVKVVITGPSGLEAESGKVDVITTAPDVPAVKPSDGITIKGGPIGERDEVIVRDGNGDPIQGKVEVDGEGNFTFTPDVPLTDDDSAQVVLVGPSGLESDGAPVELVTTAPAAPVVKPSDGQTITGGKVGKEDTVTVWDDKGNEVKGSVTVDPEGNFTFTPDVPLTEGDSVKVVITGPSGLEVESGKVEVITTPPTAPVVKPSDGITIKGGKIGKDDTVTILDENDNPIKGKVEVDDEGNFTFTPDVPLTEDDQVKVIVTGPSGLETEAGGVEIITTPPTAPVVKPSDGITIKGGKIGKDDTVTILDENDNPIKGKVEVDDEGNFTFTPDVPLTEDDSVKVVITGPSGLETETGKVDVVTTPPTAPILNPSNGTTITGGKIGKDDTVTILDENDNPIKGKVEVDDEGNFTFTPDVPLTEDDSVKVVITGPSGLETETGKVDVVTTPPTAPILNPSNGTTITGGPIGKADTVTVLDGNGDPIKGSVVTDKDGKFTFTPDVPLTEADSAQVIVTGPSGLVSDPTEVEFDFVAPDAPVVNPSAGATVTGTTEPGATVKVYDSEHKLVGQGIAGEDGSFKISFNPALADGGTFTVTATDAAGNESDGTEFKVDATVPAPPSVDPSDGKTVTGCATPGSTVTVFDKDGNKIGSAIAKDDCSYAVTLSPEQKPGLKITVQVTSPSGVVSETTSLSVGAISMSLEAASVAQGASQTAYGYGFQPGELVTAVMHSTPIDLGTQVANEQGEVVFEFTVPADVELGGHSVILTGAFSGEVSQEFQVVAAGTNTNTGHGVLSTTGFDGLLPLTAGLLLAMVGAGLVLARKRRRVHAAE